MCLKALGLLAVAMAGQAASCEVVAYYDAIPTNVDAATLCRESARSLRLARPLRLDKVAQILLQSRSGG